jgi:hypothetical protein
MAAGRTYERRKKEVNVRKLKDKTKCAEFKIESRNRFHVLSSVSADGEMGEEDQKQKEWMSDATWNKVKDREEVKPGINNSKTRQQKTISRAQYREAYVQVKRNERRDKRQWLDEIVEKAEEAEKRGDLKETNNITEKLSRKDLTEINLLETRGETSTQEEQLNRWKEHFSELINKDTGQDVSYEDSTRKIIESDPRIYFFPVALEPNFGPWPPTLNFPFHFGY